MKIPGMWGWIQKTIVLQIHTKIMAYKQQGNKDLGEK